MLRRYPPRRRHRVLLGEPVPHGNDWWISTDDVRDYAAWLNRRVDDTAHRFGASREVLTINDYGAGGDPVSERALKFHALEAEWLKWEYAWKQFYATVQDSWWAKVNAWDEIRAKHEELLGFRSRLKALGLADVPSIAGLPSDGPGPGDVAKGAGDVLTGVVIVAAVVGGVLVVTKVLT